MRNKCYSERERERNINGSLSEKGFLTGCTHGLELTVSHLATLNSIQRLPLFRLMIGPLLAVNFQLTDVVIDIAILILQ